MIFQFDPVIEFQFLFYLIPVILGFQLSIYFFYQYHKIKDVNLKLNRILLSFGTFILLMFFGALFIQISRNFIEDPLLNEIISKIGWSLAFLSPVGMEIFILTKDFSKITNLLLIKILMGLNILAIILAILAPSTKSPLFIISIVLVIINGANILWFEFLLIQNSMGKIRTKFKQFFIGTIVSLIAIFFAIFVGLGILEGFSELIFYYIGISVLFIGFMIILFSALNFPPFYEFEWRENLSSLYIINNRNNKCLYYFDFTERQVNDQSVRPPRRRSGDVLFSGGIIGIETIVSTITSSKSEKIDKIKQDDSFILLEYSSEELGLTYALVIKKDMMSIKHLLTVIKGQFEAFYSEILPKLDTLDGKQELLFASFDIILYNLIE